MNIAHYLHQILIGSLNRWHINIITKRGNLSRNKIWYCTTQSKGISRAFDQVYWISQLGVCQYSRVICQNLFALQALVIKEQNMQLIKGALIFVLVVLVGLHLIFPKRPHVRLALCICLSIGLFFTGMHGVIYGILLTFLEIIVNKILQIFSSESTSNILDI